MKTAGLWESFIFNLIWSSVSWVPMPRTTNLRNLKDKVIISERQLTSKYKMLEWRLTVWPFMSVRSFITSSSAEGEGAREWEGGRHHTGDREHYHKDNLRHLPRFPGFFVTFRILVSVRSGRLSRGSLHSRRSLVSPLYRLQPSPPATEWGWVNGGPTGGGKVGWL